MVAQEADVQTPGNSEAANQQLTIVENRAADGVMVLEVAGELDLLTANQFGERIREQLVPANRLLVLDLTEVAFLGSAGLAEMVSASQTGADTGVSVALVATNRAVLRPLEATGLLTVLKVYETLDEALGS
jgi:anti-anti-sigma factor